MALQQNPAFQTSTDEADAARARLKQVQSAWYPRVDFHQDFTRGNNPVYVFGTKLTQRQFSAADFALNNLNTPTPLDNFQTRFDGQWRLFDSGQTLFHQRSAKRLVTAADFATEQARQDLILDIVKSYYGVLVLKENAKAADEALKTAEASAQRMETMHKAGLLVDSDLLSAQVFVSQMKDRQIRATNDLAMAEMQLARQMGAALDSPQEPAETLAEPAMPTKTIQEWMQTARKKGRDFAPPNCRKPPWAKSAKPPRPNLAQKWRCSVARSEMLSRLADLPAVTGPRARGSTSTFSLAVRRRPASRKPRQTPTKPGTRSNGFAPAFRWKCARPISMETRGTTSSGST